MRSEEIHSLQYMIGNNHIVTLQCYLEDRALTTNAYATLAEYAISQGRTEIKAWLDEHLIKMGVDHFNRPVTRPRTTR